MARNGVAVTVVGNLAADPELRFTPNGVEVTRFTVAVNERVYDKASGEWKDGGTSWYRCQAWRQLGTNVAESLHKGDRVVVAGELRQRSWENDKKETVSLWELTADAVGPDLAYAQASVRKMARASRDELPPDDPWATGTREPAAAAAGAEPPF